MINFFAYKLIDDSSSRDYVKNTFLSLLSILTKRDTVMGIGGGPLKVAERAFD